MAGTHSLAKMLGLSYVAVYADQPVQPQLQPVFDVPKVCLTRLVMPSYF